MHASSSKPSAGTTPIHPSSRSPAAVRASKREQRQFDTTVTRARENFCLGRAQRVGIGQQALVSPHGDWVAYADEGSNLMVRRLDALDRPAVRTGFKVPSLDNSGFSRGLRDYVTFGARPGRLIVQEHDTEALVFDLTQSETPLAATRIEGLSFHLTMPDLPLLLGSPLAGLAGQVGLEAYGLAAAVNVRMDNSARGTKFYDLLAEVPTQREVPGEVHELTAGGRVWLKSVFEGVEASGASHSVDFDGFEEEEDDQPIMSAMYMAPDMMYRWRDRPALSLGPDGLTPLEYPLRSFPLALHAMVGDKSWMLAREGGAIKLHDLGSAGVPTYRLSAPPVPSKIAAMREAAAAAAVASSSGEDTDCFDEEEEKFQAAALREQAYAFSGDRQHMVGCFGERVWHWDLRHPQDPPEVWGSYEGDVVALSLSQHANTLIAARMRDDFTGGEFLALRRGKDKTFATLLKTDGGHSHSALNQDGMQFAAMDHHHLRLWDLTPARPQQIALEDAPQSYEYRLTFTPSGDQLICSGDHKSVIYDFSGV